MATEPAHRRIFKETKTSCAEKEVVMVHRELESCRFGFSDVGVVVV